jgi:hypothetical protein
MPLLLRIGQVLSIVGACFFGLIGVSMSTGCGDNRKIYSAFETSWGVGLYTASAWVNTLLLIAVVIGLRRRKPWVPYVAVGFWVWEVVSTNLLAVARHTGAAASWTVDLTAGFGAVIAFLYFFVKPSVRAYYQSLRPAEVSPV